MSPPVVPCISIEILVSACQFLQWGLLGIWLGLHLVCRSLEWYCQYDNIKSSGAWVWDIFSFFDIFTSLNDVYSLHGINLVLLLLWLLFLSISLLQYVCKWIVFLISFSDFLLLMYSSTVEFYILILHPTSFCTFFLVIIIC